MELSVQKIKYDFLISAKTGESFFWCTVFLFLTVITVITYGSNISIIIMMNFYTSEKIVLKTNTRDP